MRSGTIAFLLGICGLVQLTALPDSRYCYLLALAPILVLAPPRWSRCWRFISVVALGFLWALLRGHIAMSGYLSPELQGRDLNVEGYVASIPVPRHLSTQFVFVIERGPPGVPLDSRIRLSWYHPVVDISPGQRWQLTVRLKRPRGFMNPGGFDYEGWLFQQHIGATGYVRRPEQAHLIATASGNPTARIRASILDFIDTVLRDHAQRGTVSALAIGYRRSISKAQWSVLRSTGTNHLMAISGLHIGLVAGGAFFSMLWLWSRSPRACVLMAAPRAGAVAALVGAMTYAALADFSIPTQRAVVMICFVMLNILAARRAAPTAVLAGAAFAVLLIDPFSVLSPGFWLSFAAVAVILLAMSGRVVMARSGWKSWWSRLARLHLIVALGLSPLTLVFFSQMSVIAPLANVIAVPWVGLIVVPLTLSGIGLIPISSDLAGVVLLMSAEALAILWWFLQHLDALGFVVDGLPVPGWMETLCLLILTALWLLPHGVPGRWLAIFVFPLLFFRAAPTPAPGSVELSVLDVGQGLSVVVRTTRHTLVFDSGPRYSSDFDTGMLVVVPFLRDRGVRTLDVLLISHGDNDHAGGAASVVEQIDTKKIITNTHFPGALTTPCIADVSWQWDGVRFEVLGPANVPITDNNNASCVLRIVTPSARILLPGDIETPAEDLLLQHVERSRLRADILIAPHHGSRTSSGGEFVDAVRPTHVVFAVGFKNRFGFPHTDVITRYRSRGVILHDSVRDGALIFTLNPGEPIGEPIRHRVESKRFWNQ